MVELSLLLHIALRQWTPTECVKLDPEDNVKGIAYVSIEKAMNGKEIDSWIKLLDDNESPIKGNSKIHVKLQCFDVSKDPIWNQGIKNPNFTRVPYTYFPQRQGCKVDPTSLGGTHGTQAVEYFARSKVCCVRVSRRANGIEEATTATVFFSQHQKTVTVDCSIAWDVLVNFEQRWRNLTESASYPLRDLLDMVIPPSLVTSLDDPKTCNVQCFRSMIGADVHRFPMNPKEVDKVGLLWQRNNIIEYGVQDTYINAIRRAKNFIYIESQFFLGSCFA
ncbi:hypothetical protein RJT34_19784 [Clitoria ternatea]|uniref:Uncharacterized protein n=1 Tax=Clitoria ternatea TaxID=43366 RepID=A0AAN9IRN8_CLITE